MSGRENWILKKRVAVSEKVCNFANGKKIKTMTALELNAELYRAMGEIADDETLMTKVLKYVKKLAAAKKADPTLMTKEEFFARVDEAKAQYNRGEGHRMLPDEDLTAYLRRRGYDI